VCWHVDPRADQNCPGRGSGPVHVSGSHADTHPRVGGPPRIRTRQRAPQARLRAKGTRGPLADRQPSFRLPHDGQLSTDPRQRTKAPAIHRVTGAVGRKAENWGVGLRARLPLGATRSDRVCLTTPLTVRVYARELTPGADGTSAAVAAALMVAAPAQAEAFCSGG
jgi:hypothetical protein